MFNNLPQVLLNCSTNWVIKNLCVRKLSIDDTQRRKHCEMSKNCNKYMDVNKAKGQNQICVLV